MPRPGLFPHLVLFAKMPSIEDLAPTEHDVIIIGGGLIGAFIYLDCALRGLSPILFERGDFGGETTSYNTRLAHGGIRYTTRKEDWPLVIESLRERHILKSIAPHLVHDIEFILPIYDRSIDFPLAIDAIVNSRSLDPRLNHLAQTALVHAGMSTYDFLGGSRLPFRYVSKEKFTRTHLLTDRDLLGVRIYSDGKIRSPERLALEAILKGDQEGGKSFNYTEIAGFKRSNSGRVMAVKVSSGDEIYTFQGKVIINATGPWIDMVNRFHTLSGAGNLLLRVGGVHAVVSSFSGCEKLGTRALVIPTRSPQGQKRLVFAIPEDGCWLIGTTEKKIEDDSDVLDYKPSREELALLFDALRRLIPSFNLTPDSEEILHVFAGVRPLRRQERDPTSASRKDLIHYDRETGVISVTGKLTPARAVAERVTDLVCKLLGREISRCRTAKIPLFGGETIREEASQVARKYGMTERIVEGVMRTYGSRYKDVLSCCERDGVLKQEIAKGYIMAQVSYAVEHEKAVMISDVIFRRTDMGVRTKDSGVELIEPVGELMSMSLGWSREQLRREVKFCKDEIESRHKLID